MFETRDAFKAHKLPGRGTGATLAALQSIQAILEAQQAVMIAAVAGDAAAGA